VQLAAGMNLQVFTTGRGTPYGLAEPPVIKVSTRTEFAWRWSDLIDFDAGQVVSGEITIEEAGKELFHLILDVAASTECSALSPLESRLAALQKRADAFLVILG
jgi:galactarate dehydratase